MEHLFRNSFGAEEFKLRSDAKVLSSDWRNQDELPDFDATPTHWLDFDHDAMPLCDLLEYAHFAGFDLSQLWNANLASSRADIKHASSKSQGLAVAAFIQSWLLYGILASVCKKRIQVSYLVRPGDDGRSYLDTRNLHFCLQAKIFELRLLSTAELKNQASNIIQLELRQVHRWVSRFVHWSHGSFRAEMDRTYPAFMDNLDAIIPAVVRLAEVIEQTRLSALPQSPTLGTLVWPYPARVVEKRRFSLHGLGWCAFQTKMLEDTVNHSTIDWLLASRKTQDSLGHEECSPTSCARNNIDETRYEQAHVTVDCICEKLTPDLEKIVHILRSDQIPVMSLRRSLGKCSLDVHASSQEAPLEYVAISHVWADGLGGKSERGLNKCQILRLQNICDSMDGSKVAPCFWIDSLCIPRVDKEVYIKALIGIKSVYSNAASVLVLDSKQVEQCTSNSTTEEVYSSIYLSAWMQRMWTFEEAVLAKRLVFKLMNGFHVYNIRDISSMRSTVNVVWQSLATQLYRLRARSESLNIGQIYMAFRHRATNSPQDEFLSIASMLKLDTKELINAAVDQRTQIFWLLLKWVPFNVLSLDCPKLTEPGFRWAPRTMMYASEVRLDTDPAGHKSECTDKGLIGTYLTAILDTSLHGTARGAGSIFYVFVDQTVASSEDDRGLLRVYCTTQWPLDSEHLLFNALLFDDEFRRIPSLGTMMAGAALLGQESEPEGSDTSGLSSEVPVYQYVGRILIERLTIAELSSSGTIMFEGRSRFAINASATWSVQKICIT